MTGSRRPVSRRGVPDIADQLKDGGELNGTTYKVHLDGHNQLPWLLAKPSTAPGTSSSTSPTTAILRRSGSTTGRLVFLEQRATGPCGSGRSRSPHSACPRSSTYAPTLTSGRTSPRTRITTGCSITRGLRAGSGVRVPDDPESLASSRPAEAGELQPRPSSREVADGPAQRLTPVSPFAEPVRQSS